MSHTNLSSFMAATWSLIGLATGVGAKVLFDSAVKQREQLKLETWKIRIKTLEQRLSCFYWPLYTAIKRDELLWQKVFHDLRASTEASPMWASKLPNEQRRQLACKLEMDVLIPNHLEAVKIIRDNMHLANADAVFRDYLGRYVRHVDVYEALRTSGINDVDPIHVGEEYPHGLGEEVERRLSAYQQEYEELLRGQGVLDLRKVLSKPRRHSAIKSKRAFDLFVP